MKIAFLVLSLFAGLFVACISAIEGKDDDEDSHVHIPRRGKNVTTDVPTPQKTPPVDRPVVWSPAERELFHGEVLV